MGEQDDDADESVRQKNLFGAVGDQTANRKNGKTGGINITYVTPS